MNSCPSDPAESGGVTWTPDVGHPVFWGFQDLTPAQGAPREMRVFYPTHEGFTAAPPILKLCLIRYPVVLFLHGRPPGGGSITGYHRKWERLGAVLARCGYVVVMPSHDVALADTAGDPQIALAMRDLDFVRNTWADREWVDKQLTSTVVMGHSWGGLLAARVAAAHPQIGAFASLGAGYLELSDPTAALEAIRQPSFFMWAKEVTFEDLDGSIRLWDRLTTAKHAAVYEGQHFDYLRPEDTGAASRGSCAFIGAGAADLLALFISRVVKPPLSRTNVAVDLTRPEVTLTREQEFFAGAHLLGVEALDGADGCRLDLRWSVDGATGSRQLGG